MAIEIVKPFKYSGVIQAPYSKSYLQRAIAVAAVSNTPTKIIGYTPSKDALAAIAIAKEMGASIHISNDALHLIPSEFTKNVLTFNCGEAGLSTRMFSAIGAAICDDVRMQGEGSILTRPMDMIIDALTQLGARVESLNHFLPLRITQRIKPGKISIDGSESSQLLTGLLIALPLLNGHSEIHVKDLKSIPYVRMTLAILEDFGIHIMHENFTTFKIEGNQRPMCANYKVEGDWSGASFHAVGAAISGEIILKNVTVSSAQADKAILEAIVLCGGKVEAVEGGIKIQKEHLKPFDFDATNCPDLFPPLAVLAACSNGISKIKGIKRLIHKESNRAATLKEEFGKLGIEIALVEDTMLIHGGKPRYNAKLNAHNDHRIAMALALMATQLAEPILIEGTEAVSKSYPKFFGDLGQIAQNEYF